MGEHRKLDDKPKVNPKEDLANRIKGLVEAKTFQGMSPADLAALDRMIIKLQRQLDEKNAPKPADEGV